MINCHCISNLLIIPPLHYRANLNRFHEHFKRTLLLSFISNVGKFQFVNSLVSLYNKYKDSFVLNNCPTSLNPKVSSTYSSYPLLPLKSSKIKM